MAWLIGVRDLQWGRRRFRDRLRRDRAGARARLLMSGVSASFDNEIRRTVASFGADSWLVQTFSRR